MQKPMLKGDPRFLGHSFRYEILSQLRHSHVVVFVEAKYEWKMTKLITNIENTVRTTSMM